MSGRTKMIIIVIAVVVLLSIIISFLLLARFYPPLNRKLFGGEFPISFDEIQLWVKKVPERSYYRVCAKYLRDLDPENLMWWGGHTVFFADMRGTLGFDDIFFNPEDNKIYGGGWAEGKEREWELYHLGEGKIEGKVFKPLFPEGTKFTFHPLGALEITSAPRYYIKIYFPGTLKKLEKEELKRGILAEIVENEGSTKKRNK